MTPFLCHIDIFLSDNDMPGFKTSILITAATLATINAVALTGNGFASPRAFPEFPAEDSLSLFELFGPPASHDYIVVGRDTIRFDFGAALRGSPLTENDYVDVAKELGVEVAAIKAVVEIETGRTHSGFNPDKSPVINFDLAVFRKMAARNKIDLRPYSHTHSIVFSRPDIRRFGSQQAAQHARLRAAMEIDTATAIESTFYGMFQIGGFNWRKCGTSSPMEFAELMSRTERDQLELFAAFLRSSGLLPYLRAKNWSAFARGYNGPSYAARGYHSRLASAYRRHSR